MQIEDGKGRGYGVGVNSENRMMAESVSTTESIHATYDGRSFNLNTSELTLTGTASSALMYIKNTDIVDIHVEAIAVGLGLAASSTAGAMAVVDVVRNPTAGTIIDNTVALPINQNRNFGASKDLNVIDYVGVEGDTFTDGDAFLKLYQGDSGRLFATVDSVLTPGDSIGVKVQPPTGNTSMPCYIALIVHLIEDH